MPRAARLLLDNVCYHIITRGNEKNVVFREEADIEEYKKIVRKRLREISRKPLPAESNSKVSNPEAGK